MCIDMYIDMCIDECLDVYIGVHMSVCMDMCIDVCMETGVIMCRKLRIHIDLDLCTCAYRHLRGMCCAIIVGKSSST